MKFKISKKKFIILVIVLVVIVVGIVSILSKSKKIEVKQDVKNVKTQKVTTGTISTNIEYASNLKPSKEVVVLPKSGGKVATVDVNVGDKVSIGQTLFTLETTDYAAQLEQSQAGLSAASANL